MSVKLFLKANAEKLVLGLHSERQLSLKGLNMKELKEVNPARQETRN